MWVLDDDPVMRVYLDDEDLPMISGSLSAAVDAACDRAAQAGRIVVAGILDGTVLSEEALTSPDPGSTIGDELRLFTAEPRALVLEAIGAASESLGLAEDAQREASAHLDAGRTAQAMGPLARAMDLWRAVHDALTQSAALLEVPLDQAAPVNATTTLKAATDDNATIAARAGALARVLGDLRTSLEHEDWPAVSDVLTHDLPAQAQVWRGALDNFAGLVRNKAA